MADQPAVAKTYSVQYVVGALIFGLIVGVLLSSLWSGTGKNKAISERVPIGTSAQTSDSVATTSSKTTSSQDEIAQKSSSVLVIEDQPAGLSVVVAKAAIKEDNWVVIHEDRMGVPGNALGAARFIGGSTSGTIELLRGTVPGGTYHGLIYKDDGDRIFSIERDIPVRDEKGNPIQVTFKTN